MSLYNDLSQSQIFTPNPNKKCSLIVPQFSYNPFILENSTKYPSISVKEALSELNIEFSDEPIYDQINECRATFVKNGSHFPILKYDNLLNYKEMKKNSSNGKYPGLTLVKNMKGGYYIKTIDDFSCNTLLFEIGGKIVNNNFFQENKKILIENQHVYFNFFSGKNFFENKNILILNKGNIGCFIKQGNNLEANVLLKAFVKENDLVTLLCITSKDIPKDNYIISDKIFKY